MTITIEVPVMATPIPVPPLVAAPVVTAPVVAAHLESGAVATTKLAASSELAAAEPRRVLLADDDAVSTMITRRLLEQGGYTVTCVGDGVAALVAMRREYFPVLLTDWEMQVMDGLGLIHAVRGGDWPGYVYTIMLTGQDSRASLLMGLGAGADDYVTKPVDGAELLARMKTGWRIAGLEQRLRGAHEQAVKVSLTDALTGLSNRRHLDALLLGEVARARRFDHALGVVMCDIDFFKRVNDAYGHPGGDTVLQAFAGVLSANLRSHIDVVARYGGEEFALVLPECTLDATRAVTEKLRGAVEALDVSYEGRDIHVTASFGGAVIESGLGTSMSAEDLLAAADRSLYQAKESGRNRVCVQLAARP
jgi:diguanylate cyclase (GGDEF)-like protein